MRTSSKESVFQVAVQPKFQDTMIHSLVNQFFCVSQSVRVRELSEELKNHSDLWAVAVVDDEQVALGIVVVTQFQEMMARPFAHDVFDKKPVVDVMTATRTFSHDKNILTVSEQLADEVRKTSNQYYLVEDGAGKFCGIFSTKDLLIRQFNVYLTDLETAVTIQQSVVAERTDRGSAVLDIHGFSRMAKGVGGDFLSVREVAPGRWLLAVCDVSGKGVAASLVTASLGGMFSLYDPQRGLPAFVAQVNAFILQTFRMEKYLTGVFLEIDEVRRTATVCDMGHTYVGIVRDGKRLKHPTLNPFVGFVPDLQVQPYELALEPGDLLYAYTDGFVEQQNVRGEEFGIPALEALLTDHRAQGLAELANRLHLAVKEFRGDQPRGDDEAVLLVRVAG